MSGQKSKTLMESSDEDVNIENNSSPCKSNSPKSNAFQRSYHSAKDWNKCGDDFVKFLTINQHRKNTKVKKYSLISDDFRESIESSQEDITWSSSDEESTCKSKSFAKTEKPQKLPAKTHSILGWPSGINRRTIVQHEEVRKSACRSLIQSVDEVVSEQSEITKEGCNEIPAVNQAEQPETTLMTNTKNMKRKAGVSIEDFPSDEEIDSIEDLSPPLKEMKVVNSDVLSEIGISSWSSSTQNSQLQIRKKASNWVEILEVPTPSPNEGDISGPSNIQPEMQEHHTTKKKHKYVNNGLAAKLLRFQARSRVDSNIRHYQQTSKWNDSSEMLTLSIEKLSIKYGIVNTMCIPGIYSDENGWQPNSDNSCCTVLFHHNRVNHMNLSVGSLVQICPPWQELSVRGNVGKVLLCTDFCHKIEAPLKKTLIIQTDPLCPDQQQIHWSLTWNCPCSSSGSLKQCPAHVFPSLTKCPVVSASTSGPLLSKEILSSESTLTTVTVKSERIHIDSSSTILDCIQGNPNLLQRGMCFQATILRVFLSKSVESHKEISTCWSVLVEDVQGTVCLVHLPKKNSFDHENEIVPDHFASNCSWNFYGMRVLSRANRHRDPDLFSVIDAAWVCPQILAEVETKDIACTVNQETQAASVSKNTPGFCYEIGPKETSVIRSGFLPAPITVPWSLGKIDIVALNNWEQKINDYLGQRVTLMGKLVYYWTKSMDDQDCSSIDSFGALYLTDSSISSDVSGSNYIIIHCGKSFILPSQKFTSPVVVLIKDVFIQQKNFITADKFSRIWNYPLPDLVVKQLSTKVNNIADKLLSIKLSLPSLKMDSNVYSLVKVQGVIYSVDQEKAVVWQTCPKCDKEELTVKKNDNESWLFCYVCNCQVDDTVTHISMEVIIRCLALPGNYQVIVNLQQKTIESLLPTDRSEEGYDISTVLGQQLGPLFCLLKKHNKLQRKQITEFYLEEIQLI